MRANWAIFGCPSGTNRHRRPATQINCRDWSGKMPPKYGGSGITMRVFYAGENANGGGNTVRWRGGFELIALNLDLTGSSFGTIVEVDDVPDATADEASSVDIVFTNAEIDSIVAGDPFRFVLQREAADGADDYVGDAKALVVQMFEHIP